MSEAPSRLKKWRSVDSAKKAAAALHRGVSSRLPLRKQSVDMRKVLDRMWSFVEAKGHPGLDNLAVQSSFGIVAFPQMFIPSAVPEGRRTAPNIPPDPEGSSGGRASGGAAGGRSARRTGNQIGHMGESL